MHAAVHWPGLRRHLAGWRGRIVLGVFALLLVVSFVPLKGAGEPPFVASLRALAAAPVPVLAQVAKTSPEEMRQRLTQAGVPPRGDADSVAQLVGPDTRRQAQVLAGVLRAPGG